MIFLPPSRAPRPTPPGPNAPKAPNEAAVDRAVVSAPDRPSNPPRVPPAIAGPKMSE